MSWLISDVASFCPYKNLSRCYILLAVGSKVIFYNEAHNTYRTYDHPLFNNSSITAIAVDWLNGIFYVATRDNVIFLLMFISN